MEILNIVKIGGNIIDDKKKLEIFLDDFCLLEGYKILIHGGGKIATQIAADLGIESVMVEGRRVTDAAMRDVVVMVYGGLINKKITAGLQARNCNSIGLSGADGGVVLAHKRHVNPIDYGYVGDVDQVNSSFLKKLLQENMIPVMAPLSLDKTGEILNTNADTIAAETAQSLSKDFHVNLIYCFEKRGVLSDSEDENSVIPEITTEDYLNLKERGIVNKGMIPKLDNAFHAIREGIKKVIICHAHDLNQAIAGKNGTIIKK